MQMAKPAGCLGGDRTYADIRDIEGPVCLAGKYGAVPADQGECVSGIDCSGG
jgi:hypothetical protein